MINRNNQNWIQKTKHTFFKASVAAVGACVGNEIGKWCGLLNQNDSTQFTMKISFFITLMFEYATYREPAINNQNRPMR